MLPLSSSKLDQSVKESNDEVTLYIIIIIQVNLWILTIVESFTAVYFLIYFIKYLMLFTAVFFPDFLRNSEISNQPFIFIKALYILIFVPIDIVIYIKFPRIFQIGWDHIRSFININYFENASRIRLFAGLGPEQTS